MRADDLKYTLLDKLISVRDLSILQKISDLLGNVNVEEPVFKLTESQKQMLSKSEEDIRKGNVTSDDELNADEDQWLNG